MIISLIGYRGCGKTSLAPLLAASRGWSWIDADRELERQQGRSIADIFASEGEPEFRRLEADLLRELCHQENLVLATGGGAILNSDTREKLRASGPVIWLQADASTIEQRLGEDQSTCRSRPALTNLGWREEIERVLAERLPLYQQTCHIRIDTAGKTLVEVAEQTEAALRELSKQPGSSQA
ncbi:MAG: shikimate kinase [Planctomycetaceae bacterium]|nr:shikimate kinase [Planctomycetaceae bacterium]